MAIQKSGGLGNFGGNQGTATGGARDGLEMPDLMPNAPEAYGTATSKKPLIQMEQSSATE